VGGRPGIPGTGCDAGGFGEDMITTIGDVAKLGN
jgi:hypothetical protein